MRAVSFCSAISALLHEMWVSLIESIGTWPIVAKEIRGNKCDKVKRSSVSNGESWLRVVPPMADIRGTGRTASQLLLGALALAN
jgi:hypothetical protein